MPHSPYTQGPCVNCGATRLLMYAHRSRPPASVTTPAGPARARLENYGEAEIETLLTNSGTLFDYLGGNRSAVLRQWTRLKLEVMKDSNLRTLKYHELCER